MELTPIGKVKSPVVSPVDTEWGGVISEIQLDESLTRGLTGLEAFSHAIVIFYMDKSTFNAETDLIRRPQGREDMPETGIFAQRAKHRPNPIGITAVKIEGICGSVLKVSGLDAIDGTPVLDIKPYFPPFDRVNAATAPEWVERLMTSYF